MNTIFKILIVFMLAGNVAVADSLPTVHQIYQTAESGNLQAAHQMVEQVLKAHPESAKAHFVNAEILTKQGAWANARTELETAERLEPGLPFAKPQSVQTIKQLLSQNAGAAPAQSDTKPFPWMMLLLGLGALVVIGLILKSLFARKNDPYIGNVGNGGGGLMPGRGYPNAAGPAGYGSAPSGAAPYPGQAGSGIGGGIVSGLATGAAVGAGIVAGEALMRHFTDGNSSSYDSLNNPPVANSPTVDNPASQSDLGGADFGLNDSSSWDNDAASGSDSFSDSGGDGW